MITCNHSFQSTQNPESANVFQSTDCQVWSKTFSWLRKN